MRIHLANNEHAIALILDRIGDDSFCATFAVHLCGIDQCHAEPNSEPQRGDFILVGAHILAHSPGALAQHWNGFAIGKSNRLHCVVLLVIVIDLINEFGGHPLSQCFGAAGRTAATASAGLLPVLSFCGNERLRKYG
jgi:hypothetical protein